MIYSFWAMCNLHKESRKYNATSTVYENTRNIFVNSISGQNHYFWNKKRPDHSEFMKTRTGSNNGLFKGYYHTPFGKLECATYISKYTDSISNVSLCNWCKNSNKLYQKWLLVNLAIFNLLINHH